MGGYSRGCTCQLETKVDVSSCWWVLGAAAVGAPEHGCAAQQRCCEVRGCTKGLTPRGFPAAVRAPFAIPVPRAPALPVPSPEEHGLSPFPHAAGVGKASVPRHVSLLVAGAAPGQRWLGEQPQAEAPRPPHLPGRADPARDEDQGNKQRGASQGPARSPAGEGLCGARASLELRRSALLLRLGQVASDMLQPLCASVSPVGVAGGVRCCLPLL